MTTGRYGADDPESYERPRRRTRPRTKDRPRFDDAVPGVVVTVDRGRYTCRLTEDGAPEDDPTVVTSMKSRALGRKGVVVGDHVRIVGDVTGDPGSLARIVLVDERRTVLRRTADDDDPVERVVVANADQLVVVTALADPEPRQGLVDRALVAAYDAGMDPLLCHTSVSALMLALPGGGWIVDTPGIRSFGLNHVDVAQLIEAFPDLHELTETCPRACSHGEGEPECGLDDAEGTEVDRVRSFRRLLASREAGEQHH